MKTRGRAAHTHGHALDACRRFAEKWQAGFQPLSSRIPAAGSEAFSGACLAIANPGDFAPFHPGQPA
jgi:hypothetical protein